MDFTDDHDYFYDWRWGEEDKFCAHRRITETETVMPQMAYMRLCGKPHFCSEWDMPWPNAYRAEGPVYYAAVCALQGWSGMTIHTYAYGTRLDKMEILGKEASSSTIGGIAYREGIFSTWNDPAKFGLFYHCAMLVRRGDLMPAVKKIGMKITDPYVRRISLQKSAMEVHRLVTVPDGEEDSECDAMMTDFDSISREDPCEIVSDNGQFRRDIKKKLGFVDTPRTKILFGTLAKNVVGHQSPVDWTEVDGLKVEGYSDFGVIALSSLTDDPIRCSDNMLLTTIGRARNTDQVFDGDRLVSHGRAPVLAEVIEARIRIRTDRTDLQVWGVNAEGYYIGTKDTVCADGWMTFTVGDVMPASYYLIVAE